MSINPSSGSSPLSSTNNGVGSPNNGSWNNDVGAQCLINQPSKKKQDKKFDPGPIMAACDGVAAAADSIPQPLARFLVKTGCAVIKSLCALF
jgi:hypothetical protein